MKDINDMNPEELKEHRLKLKGYLEFWKKVLQEENIDHNGLRYEQALARVRDINEKGVKVGNLIKQFENAESTENS